MFLVMIKLMSCLTFVLQLTPVMFPGVGLLCAITTSCPKSQLTVRPRSHPEGWPKLRLDDIMLDVEVDNLLVFF